MCVWRGNSVLLLPPFLRLLWQHFLHLILPTSPLLHDLWHTLTASIREYNKSCLRVSVFHSSILRLVSTTTHSASSRSSKKQTPISCCLLTIQPSPASTQVSKTGYQLIFALSLFKHACAIVISVWRLQRYSYTAIRAAWSSGLRNTGQAAS